MRIRYNAGERIGDKQKFDKTTAKQSTRKEAIAAGIANLIPGAQFLSEDAQVAFGKGYATLRGIGLSAEVSGDIISESIDRWVANELGPDLYKDKSMWIHAGSNNPERNEDIKRIIGRVKREDAGGKIAERIVNIGSQIKDKEKGTSSIIGVEHLGDNTQAGGTHHRDDIPDEVFYERRVEVPQTVEVTGPTAGPEISWGQNLAIRLVSLHLGQAGVIDSQPTEWTNRVVPVLRKSYPKNKELARLSNEDYRTIPSKAAKDVLKYHKLGEFKPNCPTCRALAKFFKRPGLTKEYVTALMEHHAINRGF